MVKNNHEEVVNQVTLSKQTVSELSAFMDALSSLPHGAKLFVSIPQQKSFSDLAEAGLKACGLDKESAEVKQAFIEGMKEADRELTQGFFVQVR